MTQIKKKRQYKNKTPGQERDFEILSARRMFQAYEDAPTNSTGPAIANWDPPLGKTTKVYKRKRRELDMETLKTELSKVDGRTKNYKETVRRIKERQERLKARDGSPSVKEPVLKPNPFGHPVAEIHSAKDTSHIDKAVAAFKKKGGVITKLKPGQPKGMSKSRKAVVKMRKENAEMNKKYFDTRADSLEAAAYQSANTEVPVNPNSLRPTLHLPKKYLETKEGSLERAVEEAMTEKHKPGHTNGYKLPRQLKDPKKEKMVGTKTGTKVVDKSDPRYKKHPEHESVENEDMSLAPKGKGRKAAKALYKENEVTHFGDILRQAIEEAKKVDAIKEINKIVKTKTMGKLHGQKVDLFTASAIQQVYKAINHKNKEKMNSVMSKDIHGLLKMADFSMSKMKR